MCILSDSEQLSPLPPVTPGSMSRFLVHEKHKSSFHSSTAFINYATNAPAKPPKLSSAEPFPDTPLSQPVSSC